MRWDNTNIVARRTFGLTVLGGHNLSYLMQISTRTYISIALTSHGTALTVYVIRWSRILPGILWHPKVCYRIHNSRPVVPILGQTKPVHTLLFYFSKITFNSTLPSTPRFPSGLLPLDFPAKINYALLLFPYLLRSPPISFFLFWSPE
jgi:hypothetical protein